VTIFTSGKVCVWTLGDCWKWSVDNMLWCCTAHVCTSFSINLSSVLTRLTRCCCNLLILVFVTKVGFLRTLSNFTENEDCLSADLTIWHYSSVCCSTLYLSSDSEIMAAVLRFGVLHARGPSWLRNFLLKMYSIAVIPMFLCRTSSCSTITFIVLLLLLI